MLGRKHEREMLDRLCQAALDGRGAALVLHGEPGVGKTALMECAVEMSREFEILRTVGIEGEMALPYAALHQFCSSKVGLIKHLPEPQRLALDVAFGLDSGPVPDPFLVGLAVLGLLAEAARKQPLLCLVDDAQWLDIESARALSFVGRRLLAERVVLIFSARQVGDVLASLPECLVGPLGRSDSRALLESVLPSRLDEGVLDRIVRETDGNPLAILEMPHGLTPAQLAGGFGSPVAQPLSNRIEQSFESRIADLSNEERQLLLIAASDLVGNPTLIWAVAQLLGIPESAARKVESEGLISFGTEVVFRHPLVRSAVYRTSGLEERRKIHCALAEAIDSAMDPDWCAWHRALGSSMPDEDVAMELERCASRAQSRGGFAAAAAFLERAVALSFDPTLRSHRALVAAEAKRQAGALDSALALAAIAEQTDLDESQRWNLEVLRARIFFAMNRGRDAPPLLLMAASWLEEIDIRRARDTYLDALTAAMFAGRLSNGVDVLDVARAVVAAPQPSEPVREDLLLDGLALLTLKGSRYGTPVVKQAMEGFRCDETSTVERLSWLWLAGGSAGFIWDYESWDVLTARQLRVARDAGAIGVLPLALGTRAGVEVFAGNLPAAASLMREIDSVAEVTDNLIVPYAALPYAAFCGRELEARQLIGISTRDFLARGEGMALSMSQWATAALCNGLAKYEEAFAAAQRSLENPNELWYSLWSTVELIEAASRTKKDAIAAVALERLVESTDASGTQWALAVQARSRAVLSDGKAAEDLYREAIDRLLPTPLRLDIARTYLLFGEWLRREQRQREARQQLRFAHELFSEFGMEGFARRAEVELQATGERARKRTVETQHDLTPQEERIADLAAQGSTNKEIGAQLFISPATVEQHLSKVYRKVGVASRTQLARLWIQSAQNISGAEK